MAIKLNGSTSGSVALDAPADTSPSGTDVTLTLPTSAGSSGQYLQTNGSGTLSWQTVADTSTSVAVLTDVKTQGTAGGTFTSGAWRTRDLNTEQSDPDNIVTLSSNRFTLSAGTYLIQWECPAYRVSRHQSRLWDVTATAVVEMGMSRYDEGASEQNSGVSPGSAVVTITSDHVYEIQHRAATTFNNNGFGVESNLFSERYTRVIIWKVA